MFISLNQSYPLFHTLIELSSIVVAFTVFVITWNAKKVLENQYLYFVGIAYLFIGCLDLLHTLTFSGINLLTNDIFYANQFWIATRGLETLTLFAGFCFLKSKRKINADLLFLGYLLVTVLITLSIMYWHIFPTCYVAGKGQTDFKIIAEYIIIAVLFVSGSLLYLRKNYFDPVVFKLLAFSIAFTVLSEFSFTLYFDNNDFANAIGHFFKLISFYLIYKANVETGFTKPTSLLFNEIKESEFRYRTLANNLPVLIFRHDKNLNCTYTNASERGTSKELVIKLLAETNGLLKKLKTSDKTFLKSEVKLTIDDEIQVYCLDIISEDHEFATTDETYLVLCQDITKLKLAEEQLTELNATKDKLFSIIAHDLKNPFTTILASSELIYKSAPKLGFEKTQNLALRSHEAAKNAYTLLENLLSWSMVQTGILKSNPQKIDVDSLFTSAFKTMLPSASAKGIEIVFPPALSLYCYADINMTNTILRNLLSNAIKFSFNNTTIYIKVALEADFVKFSVTDQGVGIDAENLNYLLSSNAVVSKDGTGKEKGTGLGLQLCKDFIRLNEGKFNIMGSLGEGATFEFWLPKFRES
ncbi:MAG TPA: MASE3 domain-containing protein [Pelobium sp.]|nr:MASE3 domain-containing protein [Pelobium sp.]